MKTDLDIAREVIAGKWGIGADRRARLFAAGYDPDRIQALVNDLLISGPVATSPAPAAKPIKELTVDLRGYSGLKITLEVD